MEIIIKTNDAVLPLRREELTGAIGGEEPYQERQVIIQHEQVGLVTDTQISTGSFYLAHCQFQLTQPIQLIMETHEDTIQLVFALQGAGAINPVEPGGLSPVSAGQHMIYYLPPSRSVYAFNASAQLLDFSVVVMPRDTYMRLVPAGSNIHEEFSAQIARGQAACCAATPLTITSAMALLIRDMRASQRTGCLKRLYLEASITELLMLQLEQLQGNSPSVPALKKADTRKLNEACALLDASYTSPPTIVELAKRVGLNEFTLKRGFKEQTGTTILGYVTRKRMEDARRFLLEGDTPISEVAYRVGYKNPAHFTAAFKHYFGVLPSAVRAQPGRE